MRVARTENLLPDFSYHMLLEEFRIGQHGIQFFPGNDRIFLPCSEDLIIKILSFHAAEKRFPVNSCSIRELMILQFHPFKDIRSRGRKSLLREREGAFGTLQMIFFKRQERNAFLLLAFGTGLAFPMCRISGKHQNKSSTRKIRKMLNPLRRSELEFLRKTSERNQCIVFKCCFLFLSPQFIYDSYILIRFAIPEVLPRKTWIVAEFQIRTGLDFFPDLVCNVNRFRARSVNCGNNLQSGRKSFRFSMKNPDPA